MGNGVAKETNTNTNNGIKHSETIVTEIHVTPEKSDDAVAMASGESRKVSFKSPIERRMFKRENTATKGTTIVRSDSQKNGESGILKNNNNDESKSGSTSGFTKWTQYEIEALNAHNHLRERHGTQPVVLNKDLCRIAQAHANYLIKSKTFDHSDSKTRVHKGSTCGENLAATGYIGTTTYYNGYTAVNEWYAEGKEYDFKNPEEAEAASSFTQLLWDDTREIGQAYASRKEGMWTHQVAVAVYHPTGNKKGQFGTKVKPAIHDNFTHTKKAKAKPGL